MTANFLFQMPSSLSFRDGLPPHFIIRQNARIPKPKVQREVPQCFLNLLKNYLTIMRCWRNYLTPYSKIASLMRPLVVSIKRTVNQACIGTYLSSSYFTWLFFCHLHSRCVSAHPLFPCATPRTIASIPWRDQFPSFSASCGNRGSR